MTYFPDNLYLDCLIIADFVLTTCSAMRKLIIVIKGSAFYFPRNCDQSKDLNLFFSSGMLQSMLYWYALFLQLPLLQHLVFPKQVVSEVASFSIL